MNKPKTTRSDQGRFFDDGDFTSEHDAQFLWILEHYPEIVYSATKESNPGWGVSTEHSKFLGEPPLDGYPPVFPDAIVLGSLVSDHRDQRPEVSIDPEIRRRCYDADIDELRLSCQVKNCGNLRTIRFKFPDEKDWILTRTDLVLARNNLQRAMEDQKKRPNYEQDDYWNELCGEERKLNLFCGEQYRKACEEAVYGPARKQALEPWRKSILESPPHFKDVCYGRSFWAVIELKPAIDSLGKVLRQLKIYEDRMDRKENREKFGIEGRVLKLMILVTADTSFDAAFKSQGIFVFHIPAQGGSNGNQRSA